MKIRKARSDDIDEIYDVFITLLETEDQASKKVGKAFLEVRTRRKDFEKSAKRAILKQIKKKKDLFLVAEENKIIGYCCGSIKQEHKEFFIPMWTGYVKALSIKKEAQGKGLGSVLMDEMEKWFKLKKCKLVYLHVFANNPAVKFYKKRAYKELCYFLGKEL